MEIITHKIEENIDLPDNSCVFDIETTGLSPKYNKVILIGALYKEKNHIIIKQFFANSSDKEKELLFYFKEFFKSFSSHITFNGIAFDISFLNQRFNKYDLDFEISKEDDTDILRIVRPHKEFLGLENCKLKTVESLLNIHRKDTISGKDSVLMYKEFEKTNDPLLREKILLHNYEDIYYLSKLYKINDIIDGLYKQNAISLKKYKFTNDKLNITCNVHKNLNFNIEIYEYNYTIKSEKNSLFIELSTNTHTNGDDLAICFEDDTKITLKQNDIIYEENIISLVNHLTHDLI